MRTALRKTARLFLWAVLIGSLIGFVLNVSVIAFGFFQELSWPRFSWQWVVPFSWGLGVATTVLLVGVSLLSWSILKRVKKEEDTKKTNIDDSTTKEAAGKKEQEKVSSKGIWWKWILWVAGVGLVLWMGSGIYEYFSSSNRSIISRTSTVNLSHSAPVEIARLVICGCESNCRQFEPGTKIPTRNKEKA